MAWVAGPPLDSLEQALVGGRAEIPWGPFPSPEERGEGRRLPQRPRRLGSQLQRALVGLARAGVPP
eukprot:12692799-Alexandrium_andersonii.AAC.1